MNSPSPTSDRDLTSIGEARDRARRAKAAQPSLERLTQQQVDTIVDKMAAAATAEAEPLAALAVQETGFGVVEDKVRKNLFASRTVHEFIRPMKTVGVINSIQTFGSATIVPSHDGHGTNGLVMSPLTLLSPQFGHSSKHAHIILARKMNLRLQVMPLSGYGFDIDTPADLRWMAGLTSPSKTKSYLDEINLLETKVL